jgi:predicted kinase
MLGPLRDLMDCCWMRCVELGLDVVLDYGFWNRRDRDEIRAKAAALGAKCCLYSVSVPDQLAWSRIEKGHEEPHGSWFIDRNAFCPL